MSMPCKRRARPRTEKSTGKAKRPKKESKEVADPSSNGGGGGKRSSIYRGVTRYASLHVQLLPSL
jgi:hypothetical protein